MSTDYPHLAITPVPTSLGLGIELQVVHQYFNHGGVEQTRQLKYIHHLQLYLHCVIHLTETVQTVYWPLCLLGSPCVIHQDSAGTPLGLGIYHGKFLNFIETCFVRYGKFKIVCSKKYCMSMGRRVRQHGS